jgi:xanthine/uracil/vitamin C permease (AzgA family)
MDRFLSNVIVVTGTVVLALFWSLLDGGIFFILAAAVTGFVSWLANASDPRGAAIAIGLGVGAIVTFLMLFRRIVDGLDEYHQRVARAKRLTEDD